MAGYVRTQAEHDRREAAAEKLAADLMAARRTGFHPLTGAVREGWKTAALYRGYGVDGGYKIGGAAKPRSVEGAAGWIIWHAEGWDFAKNHPKPKRPKPLTRRQWKRRRARAR